MAVMNSSHPLGAALSNSFDYASYDLDGCYISSFAEYERLYSYFSFDLYRCAVRHLRVHACSHFLPLPLESVIDFAIIIMDSALNQIFSSDLAAARRAFAEQRLSKYQVRRDTVRHDVGHDHESDLESYPQSSHLLLQRLLQSLTRSIPGGGYVKKVGPGVSVAQVGDPVLSFDFCSSCDTCKSGYRSHCDSFVPLNFGGPYDVFSSKDGDASNPDISGTFFGQSSFANLSVVKQTSVVNVKGLVNSKHELQLFSPLGCGIQTGSGTVINAAQAGPDDIVCVIGLGGVGLSAIMGAKIQGCKQIIGIDRIGSRLTLAQDLGATHTIDGSSLAPGKTLIDAVREITPSGSTITIDTTGAPALIEAGLEFTRNRGKYVQVGSAPMDYDLKINLFRFMTTGKQFIGAVEGQAYPPEFVPKMIQWYREGRFPIDKLVKFFAAEDFDVGLKEMHEGTTIKPILCWS
nr:aryl-alcohol dehydrogenase [Quercus suber]